MKYLEMTNILIKIQASGERGGLDTTEEISELGGVSEKCTQNSPG